MTDAGSLGVRSVETQVGVWHGT